jgi:hypothetical protein
MDLENNKKARNTSTHEPKKTSLWHTCIKRFFNESMILSVRNPTIQANISIREMNPNATREWPKKGGKPDGSKKMHQHDSRRGGERIDITQGKNEEKNATSA